MARPSNRLSLPFPVRGVTENTPYSGVPADHTQSALNVRPFDSSDERLRGGQRPGTTKLFSPAVNPGKAIQKLAVGRVLAKPGTANLVTLGTEDWESFSAGSLPTVTSNVWRGFLLANPPTYGTVNPRVIDTGDSNNLSGSNEIRTGTDAAGYFIRPGTELAVQDGFVSANVWFTPSDTLFGTSAILMRVDHTNLPDSLGNGFFQFELQAVSVSGGTPTRQLHLRIRRYDSGVSQTLLDTIPNVRSVDYSTGPVDFRVEQVGDVFTTFVDDAQVDSRTLTEFPSHVSFALKAGAGLSFGPYANIGDISWGTLDGIRYRTRRDFMAVVADGAIYRTSAPAPSAGTVLSTNGTSALSSTAVDIGVAEFTGRPLDAAPFDTDRHIYFCDGTNYKRLNLATNIVSSWVADAGTLPADSDGNVARIAAVYRDRVVLSGLITDPQNWFMSAAGNAWDFDYSPITTTATQAVAGNNTDAGLVGDIVTALAPFSNDYLLIGGDRSLWLMSGDPAAGGSIDNVSRDVGITHPDAWSQAPDGRIYFFSKLGLYRIAPGEHRPELVSRGRLDKTFSSINLQNTRVILAWDVDRQGCHILFVPQSQPTAGTIHYWYDERTDSFWPEQYPAETGPTAAVNYDGDLPSDRAVFFGGWDGFIRRLDESVLSDATTAGTTPITSRVSVGPTLFLGAGRRAVLTAFKPTLGSETKAVDLHVYTGNDAEGAAGSSVPRYSKLLSGGVNQWVRQRIGGAAHRVELEHTSGETGWSFENVLAEFGDGGLQRKGGA